MRKNVITLFVGILLLGIPMVYAGKPVKNMDLYLCIGQSNMAGRGKLSPAVMDTMQNVYLPTQMIFLLHKILYVNM